VIASRTVCDPQAAAAAAAAAVTATATVAACHAALAEAARALARPRLAVCEIAVAPSGRPAIAWCSAPLDAAPLAAWFRAARRRPGHFSVYEENIAGMTAAGGDDEAVHVALLAAWRGTPAQERALGEFCGAAARHLHRLRREAERQPGPARAEAGRAMRAALFEAASDLLWEADAGGTMRVLQIFHGRTDLASRFHGCALRDLTVSGGRNLYDLAAEGRVVRLMRLAAGAPDAPPLYVTACPAGAAAFPVCGAISAGPDMRFDRLDTDAAVLRSVVETRRREREARCEAESMLQGLRILLAGRPMAEKLAQLARCVADAVDGTDLRLMGARPGKCLRLLMPESPLSEAAAAALDAMLVATQSVTLLAAAGPEAARLRLVLDMGPGDILLAALAVRSERLYLICRPRRAVGACLLGRVERLALLLQQALLLRDDQDRLVHSAKLAALGRMSAGIAHELRQPLNTISLAAQNIDAQLDRGTATEAWLREKTVRILSQVDRACRVMDRMRRFGRKSGGAYKPVPLHGIVDGACGLMEDIAAKAGVRLVTDVPKALTVRADALEIEQVLVNLVQNAIDAMAAHPPRGEARIAIAGRGEAKWVRLSVEDTGPGFAPGLAAQAAEAFFTTKPEGAGTGLGLSIAAAILNAHGGRLFLGNAETGARVTLVLPHAQD